MSHLADFLVKQGIKRKAARSKAPTHLSKAQLLARLADAEAALKTIQGAANDLGRDAFMRPVADTSDRAYAIRDMAEKAIEQIER